MQRTDDPIALAQKLVRCNTISGGDERAALDILAPLLEEAGFSVTFDFYDPANPKRCSLSARIGEGPSILLCGHIDTVPLGAAPWDFDPLKGEISDGKLLGRGASDMKSGAAALTLAACAEGRLAAKAGKSVTVQIYGGEETGCEGSFHMAGNKTFMKNVKAAIVGEPSGALPLCGHKGTLWMKAVSKGVTAHGSMPEKGVNALDNLIRFGSRMLESFRLEGEHPVLGHGTWIFSTMKAGLNINSVPDSAALTLDIRTIPGQDNAEIRDRVIALAEGEAEFGTLLDIPPVWTDPDKGWLSHAFDVLTPFLGGRPGPMSVAFFTDAAALRSVMPDLPVLILGPGPSSEAHQTNEFCPTDQITACYSMYRALLNDWAKG